MGSATYTYDAVVVRWIDGDSLVVDVDLGFRLTLRETVRLYGANTPEMNSKVVEQRALAEAAKNYAERLAPPGSHIAIQSYKARATEKYGRWLAVVHVGGVNVSEKLIASGYAVAYMG